jgi:serine/threonine-protein kinase
MAQVWLATDLKMSRQVVVKLMHKHLAGEEESMKRFEHECRLMAQIKHPNVVTIYDAGCYRNWLPYLVMEYVKGESLRDLIDDRGAAPIKAAVAITTQICAGLQDAHDAGIVHRDLKPENILIQDRSYRQDAVKIADFGIARLLSSKERVTRDGMVIGTIEYISPEQLEDTVIDGRADLYALGIMLFEILTGQMPYSAKTVEGMMMQHLLGKPELPSAKRDDIAPGSDLDQIVEKCLQKKARDRYQSADELREALTRVWVEQN